MKNVLTLVVSLLVLSHAAPSQNGAALYERVSKAVVLIKTDRGAGSGFIVRPDGLIVTNQHVMEGANEAQVTTQSGEVFDQVYLLAEDERRDLAILKIAGFDLPVIDWGSSDETKPGDHLFVLGNPLGNEALRATIGDGIVSGMRDLGDGYKVIQMTAPISPGNSGGPVVSEEGKVIGISTFKLEGGEGLNFAIPVDYARGLIGNLDVAGSPKPLGKLMLSSDGKTNEHDLSGYWKSTSGSMFLVRDHGEQIVVLNISYPRYTYDFHREANLIFGLIYPGASEYVLKLHDPDHIHMRNFKWRKRQGEARIRGAEEALRKPRNIWIRVR